MFALAPGSVAAAAPGRGLPFGLWLVLLPPMLALGLGLHWTIARGLKALLRRVRPLAIGEPEIAGYDRVVYHSTQASMLAVVALAASAGMALWAGAYAASVIGWSSAAVLVAAAVALDLWHWERVTVSAQYVWFQRGLAARVHQVLIDNVRDARIEERASRGLTLRGRGNRTVRLQLRMRDRIIAALPKTDAASGGRDAVDAIADLLNQQIANINAARVTPTEQQLIARELRRRVRRGEVAPPPAMPQNQSNESRSTERARQQRRDNELSRSARTPG